MPNAALVLVFNLTAATATGAPPRVVQFADGHTSVSSEGDVDHVVVEDAKGNLKSESWCDSGRFDDYFSLFTKFKDAVAGGERDVALRLVDYPFRVNGAKGPLVFKTASALSKSYAKVFTPKVQAKIRMAEPAALFCRNGQAMLGDGVIWANRSGVAILNP